MSKEYTATAMRQNPRVMRAQPLLHLILQAIRPHLRDDEESRYYQREEQIFNQIRNELEQAGAEIINDYTREAAGLPPRGPDGWTLEEIIELEKRRLEIMMKPPSFIIDPNTLKLKETPPAPSSRSLTDE
ncbi:MAG TPA: hypothetical protein VKA31_00340 [Mariprofundaceae bacterium]|nr:hypothetical protein [Mariprofundaceae bacterium]